jgi:hypothetical protein
MDSALQGGQLAALVRTAMSLTLLTIPMIWRRHAFRPHLVWTYYRHAHWHILPKNDWNGIGINE